MIIMNISRLLKFWWEQNPDKITSDSLTDCHVKGLNSIMFNNHHGQRIRLFVTDEEHELDTISSIAYHTHRYDIIIDVIFNTITNVNAKFNLIKHGKYNTYKYKSCILDGKGSFTPHDIESKYDITCRFSYLFDNNTIKLDRNQFHTVIVPKGEISAWIIYEGIENPNYIPIVFSDKDVSNIDLSTLYNPISKNKIDNILNNIL